VDTTVVPDGSGSPKETGQAMRAVDKAQMTDGSTLRPNRLGGTSPCRLWSKRARVTTKDLPPPSPLST
jgi:hypothetical protein